MNDSTLECDKAEGAKYQPCVIIFGKQQVFFFANQVK